MRRNTFNSTITIRTPADLRRAIDAAAERENTTASDWLRRTVAAIVTPDDPPSGPAAPAARTPLSAAA